MDALLTNQINEQKRQLSSLKSRRSTSPVGPPAIGGITRNPMSLLSPSFRQEFQNINSQNPSPDKRSPSPSPNTTASPNPSPSQCARSHPNVRPNPTPNRKQIDIAEKLQELPFSKKVPTKPEKTYQKQ
jgi:hypothetical protein